MPKPTKVFLPYRNLTPIQRELASAIASGARVVAVVTGIRGSKTYGACMEGLKQIYQYQRMPNLGWVLSPTYPMSLIPERMWRRLAVTSDGRNLILAERRGERAFLMYPPSKLRDKFYRVEFKTADDPDRLRGAEVSWVVMDEAAMMKPEVFDIIRGRVLSTKGIIIIATTPKGKNWLYQDVYLKSLEDPSYVVIRGKTEDNQHLEPDEVQKLYQDYAAKGTALARQEMCGEFVEFEGAVFDQFRPGDHVIGERPLPDTVPVFCGIDWGYNDPFVCVWVAKYDGCWVVLDEYYKSHGLLGDHAAYVRNHALWPQVSRIWCDPSRMQERKEFLALGVKTMPARRPDADFAASWPVMRARLINNLFARRIKDPWREGRSLPGLVYFDKIRHGLRETMGLQFKRTLAMGESPDGRISARVVDPSGREVMSNAKEEIVPKDDHFVDALGYCLFSEIRALGNDFHAHYWSEPDERVVEQKLPEEQKKAAQNALFLELEEKYAKADAKTKKPRIWTPDPFDTLGP